MLRSLCATVVFLAVCAPAFAHKFPIERHFVFQAWDDNRLYVVAKLEIPSGRQQKVILAMADVDRNGLAEKERTTLKADLVRRLLDGLRLRIDGNVETMTSAEAKLQVPATSKAPLVLILSAYVPLKKTATELTLETGGRGDPLHVELVPGRRAPNFVSKGRLEAGRLLTTLARNAELVWRYPAVVEALKSTQSVP